MKKKLLTVLLCLCMAAALLPAAALAAEDETKLTEDMLAGSNYILSEDGSYYLNTGITLTQTLTITGKVTLNLSGMVLDTGDGFNGAVIKVANGGHLTLKDTSFSYNTSWGAERNGLWSKYDSQTHETVVGTTNGGCITGGTGEASGNDYCGGGVYVADGGTFTMQSGNIVGNRVHDASRYSLGAGVYVAAGGTFEMSGGRICGNYTVNRGGGVYVAGESATKKKGTFTMTGGTISDNAAGGYGGGVCVDENGSFTMSGGTVGGTGTSPDTTGAGNTAIRGGGVYVAAGGTFEMSSTASITGNKVTASGSHYGGGVYVEGETDNQGIFTMSGGSITGNSVTSTNNTDGGGGVYVYGGSFEMSGGTIGGTTTDAGNTAKYGSGVHQNGGTVTMSDTASISGNALPSNNGEVGSGAGVYIDGTGSTFTMSGGTISQNAAGYYGGGVCVNNGSTFNMSGGKITGNTKTSNFTLYGGGVYVGGTFSMSGGEITGNNASYGGGVCVCGTGSSFTMNGGSIGGSDTSDKNTAMTAGGGVYVTAGGSFTMSGTTAKISHNQAYEGGGVYIDVNSVAGTFTMNGGTISGNSANNNGGGVCIYPLSHTAQFNMTGGSITGNNAGIGGGGGGVHVSSTGTFTVSGDVTIKNNVKGGTKNTSTGLYEDGTANNVYVPSGTAITVSGALSGGNGSIGVTTAATPTESSPVQFAMGSNVGNGYTLTADDKKAFFPDLGTTGYYVSLNTTANKLYLNAGTAPHGHEWTYTLSTDKKTITHTCTAEGCSLENNSDGSVTIAAPTASEGTLTYDGSEKTATTG